MFICCLKQLIEKEEAVAMYANVGLQFMAKFAASLSNDGSDDMHEFLEAVFDWVLKVRCTTDDHCYSNLTNFSVSLLFRLDHQSFTQCSLTVVSIH